MITRSRKLKRKLELEPPPVIVTKKHRQKLPRRRRQNFSPVLLVSDSCQNPRFSVDSSSGSDYAAGDASCNSSRASIAGKGNTNSRNESSIDSTRNQRFEKRNENEVEVSESSCADSNSFARDRSRRSILKFKSGRECNNQRGEDDVSEVFMKSDITGILKFKSGSESKNIKKNDDVSCGKSEITCEEQVNSKSSSEGNGNMKISSESNGNDVVSFSSFVRASLEEEKDSSKENRALECEYSVGSKNLHADENCADLVAQSMTRQESENDDVVVDLTCSEELRLSNCDDDDESEYCSSQGTMFSEFHSEIFGECSEQELSDYTPSLFVDSGSQFSEGSVGETPSPTYLLFLQYRKEFTTLTSASPVVNSSSSDEDEADFVRFEDSDDEDSYQMLRKRERKQGFVSNYAERYFSTTEFGETVLEQRAQMVHWIVEQSCRKQLRQETIFLGVNLLDRFLSKGYFKAKKRLQIVGIACLTLATRIEENQQQNRVGQSSFNVGSNRYSRGEVVAMEWMVQEVLKFQCFLPTIYNFLWYYLKAANADAVVEKRVKYLAVLTLSSHEQLCYWPSTVAAALVVLAGLEFNQSSPLKVIGIHVRSKDENLYECIGVRYSNLL
ncbi:cyclin B [Vigna unguiculata]|uniref:B-like cyclin n=1 Tax=Vigna unguiculata TaxID=3917 RepID=A0A4D6LMI1_VIGUN|nr:cyclin B [Vigna unguiculata]